MMVRPKARELIVGVADDPTFGPVIVFGQGGTAVEVIGDKALALPPLDLALAHGLIARTRSLAFSKPIATCPRRTSRRSSCFWSNLRSSRRISRKSAKSTSIPSWPTRRGVIAVDARISVAPVELGPPGPLPAIRVLRSGLIQKTGNGTGRCRTEPRSGAASPARRRDVISGLLGSRDAR